MRRSSPDERSIDRSVVWFVGVTVLLSFASYLLPVPREVVPLIMVMIPLLVASVIAGRRSTASLITGDPRTGLRWLFGSPGQWSWRLSWIGAAILIGLAMRATITLMAWLTGEIERPAVRSWSAGQFIGFGVILILAALPEEIGWRRFAAARLLERHRPLAVGLGLGLGWGALHLTLHFPGMPQAGLPLLPTVAQLVGLSIVLTWIFVRSGGSIVATTLLHAAQSFFVIVNDGIPPLFQHRMMAGVWLAAGLIVVLADRAFRPTATLMADT